MDGISGIAPMRPVRVLPSFLVGFFLSLFVLIIGFDHAQSEGPNQAAAEKPFVIGLVPEQNIFKQVERYTPLADYLSARTKHRIKLTVMTRYETVVKNFVSSKLDGAFLGSFAYVLAHQKLGVEILARPEAFDGTSTYHGLIFVRRDSGIRSIREMKGKRFAFVDEATTAGYVLPLYYFQEHGIDDYKNYFRETYFTGTHEDAIYDVLNKKADIGAAKSTVFTRLADNDRRIREELMILRRSPEVPENGFAVRRSMDPAMKNLLKKTLLDMHTDALGQTVLRNFGARRFIVTTDEDYEPVFRYARKINVGFTRHNRVND